MGKNFKPKYSFEIKNSKGFFKKLENEYSDFDKEHLNPRHAINCAINSWHLTDWTFQEFFKSDERFNGNGISGLVKYQKFLKESCPELEYMRIIANGIKHCKISVKDENQRTAISSGDFSPYDYSRYDYLVPRFIIILENNEEIDFEEVLVKTIGFWRKFIKEKHK